MPGKSRGPQPGQGKLDLKVNGPGASPRRLLLYYLIIIGAMLWLWQDAISGWNVRTISYSEFKQHLASREVTECAIQEDAITGQIVPHAPVMAPAENKPTNATTVSTNALAETSGHDDPKAGTKPFLFRTLRVEDAKLVEQLEAAGVKFVGARSPVWFNTLLGWLLPVALFVALLGFMGRRFGTAGESLLSVGKSKAKLVADKDTGVSFQDVAGCDEAKFELQEVVEFLKHPAAYQELGAKIPKGVLVVGPPGTGKTLLARAVAGEAKVPFFSLSGSDFVEMFVGVGAARVRDLFLQAKGQAPCIVFIDELDAIGRQRGVHIGVVNDEREQTLNQLLSEMDGFEPNTGVIILAATNRPEVLDRALLRPGRFDRQIVLDAPDVDGREAILQVHAKGKPLANDVALRRIAQATAGFSGADLANALNEAALLAARRKAHQITQADLENAVEKVVAGPERKSRRLSDEEKRRVAHHEVGHALVAAYSQRTDPVHKISIIPRGRAALGYTLQLPTEDQFLLSRHDLLERIRVMLGGRAAEELAFGEVTTGAQNDLEHATALARQMICLYGMSDTIGLANCAQRPATFLSGPETALQRDCSEQTAREIDQEVKALLDGAYAEAQEILRQHRDQLEGVSVELLKQETLDGARFYELIGRPAPPPTLRAPRVPPAPDQGASASRTHQPKPAVAPT
jgi:cell division protease FtsH